MQRTTITLFSCFFFAAGIWFGTSANHSYLVSKAALWIYLLTLIFSNLFSGSDLKLTCAWLSVPLAVWAGWSYVHLWQSSHTDTFADNNTFVGTVRIIDLPDERPNYATFLTVEPVQPALIHHAILIKTDRYPEYTYGDTIWVKGTLKHPAILDSFDYPLFLQQRGVTATMTSPQIRLNSTGEPSLRKILFTAHNAIEKISEHYLAEPEASFLNGILIGNEHAIPPDVQNDLSITSTTHLIVVGGAKLSIFLNMCLALLPIRGRSIRFIAIFVMAILITLLTNGSAGVVRGAVVAVLSALLYWQERIPSKLSLVVLPAAAMLITNPLMLKADVGFQISCLAYAGLVFLTNPLLSFLEKIPRIKDFPKYILHPVAENTAITLAIGALSFALFGETGIIGILVNPAVFWLLSTLMFSGIFLMALSWWPAAAFLLSLPLWLLLHGVLKIIHWGALMGEKL